MAQEIINIGTLPNDGQGDPLRVAFGKINNNFSQLYNTGWLQTDSYTVGNAASQVIFQAPADEFSLGQFFIKSNDPGTINQQTIKLDAQLSANSTAVKFTAYSTTLLGDPVVSNYDMDVASGKVRILVSPNTAVISNQSLYHFITYQVAYQGDAPEGLPIGLDGYVDAVMSTETAAPITTEETP
jgi:hypothetical protein